MISSKKSCSCCISHIFSQTVSANPTKTAILHHRNSSSFTYSRLLSAVNSLSSRLPLPLPSATSLLIGIFAPPSADYVASALAALRLGAAFLPLDPSWPKQRVLSAIASSNVRLVIAAKSLFGLDSPWIADSAEFRVLWFSIEEEEEQPEEIGGGAGDLNWPWPCESEERRRFCYVMYTSGSTGTPKGVCGTEEGILNRFLWMQELYPLAGDEVLLFKTSISFVDHLQEFLSAVLTGCTLVVPPVNEIKRNLFSILDFVQEYSINRLTVVPSLMRAILPALESDRKTNFTSSLKLLVLSGEVLPLSLWDRISKLLPGTSILNLYGSTEVSGDCTYFDCKRLRRILESETLTSVPIGVPIANCDIAIIGDEDDLPDHGEVCVSGVCNSAGYYYDSVFVSLDQGKIPQDSTNHGSADADQRGDKVYFRTGDFARRLRSGDFVFLGRRDRTIKLNGHRIALEEIEDVLRRHPDVDGGAVIFHKSDKEGVVSLIAYVILRKERVNDVCGSHIKSWITDKLPSAMVPQYVVFVEAFPTTSSGKVDYTSLMSEFLVKHRREENLDVANINLLQCIKKAFCDVLMMEEISDDDDFFMMGGNSLSAAHVSNNLGIDMRFLYRYPSPSKLSTTLLALRTSSDLHVVEDADSEVNLKEDKMNSYDAVDSRNPTSQNLKSELEFSRTHLEDENHGVVSKRLKLDFEVDDPVTSFNGYPWNSTSVSFSCSFSRCNKVIHGSDGRMSDALQPKCTLVPKDSKISFRQLWKVCMGSCVDASPLIMFKGREIFLFIGSHSHEFMCIDARSGYVQWKIHLEGRVECSAAILDDFSQVIVGCYEGNLYFIDTADGKIRWTFKTSGEVKSQPVVDCRKKIIWCGSHDHHLYALDYISYCCIYKAFCGGSVFGSPVIDEVNDLIYVASTNGQITAISIKASPFEILWVYELEAPAFGSLSLSAHTGNVICCLVDGHVLSLDSGGSVLWKHKTSGPIFAGACISPALPLQVLICSRNGSIFSFEPEKGKILWEYNVGDPITSSAYVDEHLCLSFDPSIPPGRLVCVCSSSGNIILLQVNTDTDREARVEELARIKLEGDLFSSPVMIGGRIFVGCRDDYVHCLAI